MILKRKKLRKNPKLLTVSTEESYQPFYWASHKSCQNYLKHLLARKFYIAHTAYRGDKFIRFYTEPLETPKYWQDKIDKYIILAKQEQLEEQQEQEELAIRIKEQETKYMTFFKRITNVFKGVSALKRAQEK